nr:hypothetical protein [Sedimentibacter sp.]
MNNNYKIIRTIFENVFQRVLECKDNDTGDVFYNNVITNQKIINLIDIDGLNNLNSNVLNCYRTEDRIFIVTKSFESLELDGRSIKEYVCNNKLSLKQQFNISKKIIELSASIFELTDVVQQKILDLNKIYIDKDDDVIVDCNLIFEQEYDIRDNETFKRMGNILHYIFSGEEIVDYNISELVPPDMLKIIVRCLTKEYMHPKDALKELSNSPIYNMINPNTAIENQTNASFDSDMLISNRDYKKESIITEKVTATDDGEKSNLDVLDIYLNNNVDDGKIIKDKNGKKNMSDYLTNKDIRRAAIFLIIIVFVLMIGNHIIKNYGDDSEDVSGKNTDVVQPGDNNKNSSDEDIDSAEEDSEDADSDSTVATDSTGKFLNKSLLESIGYTGAVAEIDDDIYVEGDKSLVVKNDEDGKVRALFAAIDFTDSEYSYMLKKQIAVAAKTKSESDVSALIILEAFKDGKLASTFHTSVQIYDDMWSQNTVPINVTNADSLNIYIEYSGKNKVWIDSIYIDVVK